MLINELEAIGVLEVNSGMGFLFMWGECVAMGCIER